MPGLASLRSDRHLCEALEASERWLSRGVEDSLGRLFDDASETFPRRLKALCELAFLEYHVTRHPSEPIRRALVPPLSRLWRSGELLTLWRYNLVHANLFLPLVSAAIAAGGELPSRMADVATLARLTARHRKERLPFRTLDLLHGLYKVTADPSFFSQLQHAAEGGCLGALAYVQDFDPSDDYALTHTVFYVTDFGARPWPTSLADVETVSAVLDVLSTRAERERNLDLVAEYVLAREMLGRRDGRYRRELDLLAAGYHEAGYWPGPADLAEALRGKTASPADGSFLEHYHTTLVAREALLRADPQP